MAVWTGYSNRLTPIEGDGFRVAANIYRSMMEYLSEDDHPGDWTMPEGLHRSGDYIFKNGARSSNWIPQSTQESSTTESSSSSSTSTTESQSSSNENTNGTTNPNATQPNSSANSQQQNQPQQNPRRQQ